MSVDRGVGSRVKLWMLPLDLGLYEKLSRIIEVWPNQSAPALRPSLSSPPDINPFLQISHLSLIPEFIFLSSAAP